MQRSRSAPRPEAAGGAGLSCNQLTINNLNSAIRRRPALPRRVAAAAAALVAAACGGGDPAAPDAPCSPAPTVIALAPLASTTVRPAEVGACVRLGGPGAHYLVVAQFAAEGSGAERNTFALAAETPAVAGAVAALGPLPGAARDASGGSGELQAAFDRTLREREAALPAAGADARPRARVARAVAGPTVAPLPAEREFKVLRTLDGGSFATVRAALRYTGTNVAVYLDRDAPVAGGFTDESLREFGDLVDQTLYGIDVAAFGPPSDIDANGKVIVVLTTRVNALTPSARCRADGFVTGYFYGADLVPAEAGSNRGELFFAFAPDPAGASSCPHTVAEVVRLAAPTFIHEFQHMISYNQHRLARDGRAEAVWLNEGMSHIAEELGSLHYERRYPAPEQRAAPGQLLPDSAQTFGTPNFVNAYNYLARPRDHSVTSFAGVGTLPERGAAWLFLRWLVDQHGEQVLRRLEETTLTGDDNVAAAAGRPFDDLFADFGAAVWADSVPGLPRDAVPARLRFTSRQLRSLFAQLNAAGAVSGPFPVQPAPLGGPARAARDMKAGTLDYYDVRVPAESASVRLRFAPGADDRGFRPALRAQLTVLRLPE